MTHTLSTIIEETERLLALTEDKRKSEGIYADNTQLKFLLKKIKSSKMDAAAIKAMEKYISDFASSDSKILMLIDNIEKPDA